MRLWNRVWRVNLPKAVAVVVLSLPLTVRPVAGQAQSGWPAAAAEGHEGNLGRMATVSVAALRVSREAWRHFDRAKSAVEHSRLEEFERETAKALEIAPEFAEAHLLRATVLVRAMRFPAAVDEVEAARRSDPDVIWAGVILAGAYNGMHRYDDALRVLNAQHGIESDSWQAKYERSRAEIGLGDVAAGLRWSARALDSAPEEFADVHLVRANALLLGRRWSEAQSQMAIYLGSKTPQVHRAQVLALRDVVRAQVVAEIAAR